ncbi:hypothetical protein SC1_01471 [Sphingopyxis sp. C-1]|nr:hypothetical protein SC1_01471 [Sphingopyxis sp. C-1]
MGGWRRRPAEFSCRIKSGKDHTQWAARALRPANWLLGNRISPTHLSKAFPAQRRSSRLQTDPGQSRDKGKTRRKAVGSRFRKNRPERRLGSRQASLQLAASPRGRRVWKVDRRQARAAASCGHAISSGDGHRAPNVPGRASRHRRRRRSCSRWGEDVRRRVTARRKRHEAHCDKPIRRASGRTPGAATGARLA